MDAETPIQSALADLIERHHEQLLERFLEFLYATSVPPTMERDRALDSAGDLLRELAISLRTEGELHLRIAELSPSAKAHGAQRFDLGVDLSTVVREYRGLQDAVFELIEESPEDHIELRELRLLARFVMGASARSVESYARERDIEMERQTLRHVGFLAHELRNPLGAIALGLGLAKEAGDLKSSRTVAAIERGVARMQGLIDGALVEARLREGGEVVRVRLDIVTLVREISEEASPELEAKGQRLELDLDEDEIVLDGDARLLGSAISNLVRNAVKFSARDTTIHLRVRTGESRVIVEVEDACGGLPEGAVHKMFDPFVQAGKDRSGFGLGLAIASQAVRAHDGSIRVHDLPGRGCVFALELPMHVVGRDEELTES